MVGRSWFSGVAATSVLLACAGAEPSPAGQTGAVSPSSTDGVASSSSTSATGPSGTSAAAPIPSDELTANGMPADPGTFGPSATTAGAGGAATATTSTGMPIASASGDDAGNDVAGSGGTTSGGASNDGPFGAVGGASGSANNGGSSNGGGAGQLAVGGGENAESAERRFILRDEGSSRLTYVDLGSASDNWSVVVPAGRDLQLIGDDRVLIGTDNGFEERSLRDGSKLDELTSFPGTIAAQRLRDGSNLLVGLDWQNQDGITLIVVDDGGNVSDAINYADYGYVRLVRPTPDGTYLVTADAQVFEGDADGSVVWQVAVTSDDEPHAWTALRLANGNTLVAAGYAANLQVFSPDEQLVDTITGPSAVNPVFFSGLQVLASGNYLVANWQGHGEDFGGSGHQLLEYDPQGDLVWSWQQDPTLVSSLQAVILMDGLDTSRLHVIGENGAWVPVP